MQGDASGLTENVVSLLMEVGQVGARQASPAAGQGDNAFFQQACRTMVRNLVDLLLLAGSPVSVADLCRLVSALPRTPDHVGSEAWQFLHRDLGSRYAGPQAALAAALIFFWPALDPRGDPGPMLLFLAALLAMYAASRVGGLRNRLRGVRVHRYYHGTPRLMRFLPRVRELVVKRVVEPALVAAAAGAAFPLSAALGSFLLASAAGLAATISACELAARERAEAMYDQLIGQEGLAERYRRLGDK